MMSEARLRAQERSYGSVQTDSEARLRLAGAPATGSNIKINISFLKRFFYLIIKGSMHSRRRMSPLNTLQSLL